MEPAGDPFNSVVRLEESSKRPHNPMINAGAIAVTDLAPGSGLAGRLATLLAMFKGYTSHYVTVDMPTHLSERSTGHRNHALAYLMLNFVMIQDNIQETLDLYFQQCSLLATCHYLAVMVATLASGGVNRAPSLANGSNLTPFALSLSKGEQPPNDRNACSCFDRLSPRRVASGDSTNGITQLASSISKPTCPS